MLVIEKNFYNKPVFWIYAVVIYSCVFNAAINILNFPTTIAYALDIMCFALMLMLIPNIIESKIFYKTGSAATIVFLLFIESLIGYIINAYNIFTYIWGVRTLFRFMIFYVGCISFLEKDSAEKIFKFLYYILLISVPITTIQYALGYDLDSVTGFFSQGKSVIGGSAGQNILLVVVCTYVIIKYFNGKISLVKMLLPLFASIYMAAIGELKFFYFELMIIAILSCVFTKISWKKVVGLLTLILIISMGMMTYNYYYGGGYYYTTRGVSFYSVEAVEEYIGLTGQSYGSYNSLNRTTALPYVWDNFLGDAGQKLFGLGLGYADNFSFDIFSSGFLESHQGLGYSLWAASLELTNIGLVGLALCFAIFVAAYITANKEIAINPENSDLCEFAKIMAILSMVMMFYNQSIILDIAAPMMFFSLSLPYILRRERIYGG